MNRSTLVVGLALTALPTLIIANAVPALSAEVAGGANGAGSHQDPGEKEPKGDEKPKKKDPSPSPTISQPAGDETGCRDIVAGRGSWVRPVTFPNAVLPAQPIGTGLLSFEAELAAPSCPEVTYTFVLRGMDGTELERVVKSGESPETNLQGNPVVSVRRVLAYGGNCIAVDVTVTEGDVVHDSAPDVREGVYEDLCDVGTPGSPGQTWR